MSQFIQLLPDTFFSERLHRKAAGTGRPCIESVVFVGGLEDDIGVRIDV